MKIETIKVLRDDGNGAHLINKSDFDPKRNKAVGDDAPKRARRSQPAADTTAAADEEKDAQD